MFSIRKYFKNKFSSFTEEKYLFYKEKYGDKILLLKRGNYYGIDSNKLFNRKLERPVHFYIKDLDDARNIYIETCRKYEESLKPIEIC